MLKSSEEISATRVRLTIEIPVEKIEAAIQKELLTAQAKTRIPGFRQGKAPLNMIEKKYGKEIEGDVLEKLVPDSYYEAVKEAGIKPMGRPKIENEFDFKRNEAILLTFAVDRRPEIAGFEYESIEVSEKEIEVKDDEIDVIVKSIAAEKGTYEAVEDAAASGDLVTIDFRTAEGMEKSDVVIRVGTGPFPKEFFDSFIGKKKGDEFDTDCAFAADSPSEFAGKSVKFSIKVKEIKRRNNPAIDDELAKDMGLENLADLREKVKEDVVTMKKGEQARKLQVEILDKLLEKYSFDAPEGLIEGEFNRLKSEAKAQKPELTDEEIEKEYRAKAIKNARIACILEIVCERENVAVSEDELKQEIFNFAMRYGVSPEDIIKYYVQRDGSLEGIRTMLADRKAMQALLEKAKKTKE